MNIYNSEVFRPAMPSTNEIDLSDYFVDKSSYNPVVYIHKRYLSKGYNEENPEKKKNISKIQNKSHHIYKINDDNSKTKFDQRDSLIEQTIKFAKDIIPITIPPNTNIPADPVYYTIKSSKKTKRKHEPCEHKSNHNRDVKYNNDKLNQAGLQRESKRTKDNAEDTVSRSSQNNTIDDTNENRSLCCSLSEMSDQKRSKEIHDSKNKRKEIRKVIPSETFEAFASEYINTNESNIKIHLMNEKEKQLLCESISVPIAKSIRGLFLELNNPSEVRHDILCMHKSIDNQSHKLDNILEKLTRIENKIDKFSEDQNDTSHSNFRTLKTSKLEEIARDISNVKDSLSSEEELAHVDFLMKRKIKTASITSVAVKDKDETEDEFSKGENIPEHYKESTSQMLIKPERPNRIPARFCWTDTVRKN